MFKPKCRNTEKSSICVGGCIMSSHYFLLLLLVVVVLCCFCGLVVVFHCRLPIRPYMANHCSVNYTDHHHMTQN